MNREQQIAEGLRRVRERIATAARACGRDPTEVRLLAVSKTFPAADLRAAQAAGQDCFGESYLNEALPKIAALADPAPEWHFIGPLQSNKTRAIAEHFAWVHSVDRLKLARRLNDLRPAGLPPLNVCIQVNISGETTKSGATLEELPELARAVAALPQLRLRGLMAIPAPTADVAMQRAAFSRLREARDSVSATLGLALDTLSMGMSDDLEAAIAEGSTLVRVGNAIFGARG